jgi:DNA uptake protein ComE-like DNA-binding protein
MARRHGDESISDLRLPVLILLGAIILAVGRYTPEPDLQAGVYYLSPSTEQTDPEILRILQTEAGHGEAFGLTKITSELSCAETPPELALFFDLPLPVNRADHHTLTMLSGIGPKLAERIIVFREKQGDISGPENFIRIKGIGLKMTKRLSPLLCFSGTEKEY